MPVLALLLLALQDPEPPLEEFARRIADLIREKPPAAPGLFHESFRKQVPPPRLRALLRRFHSDYGRVASLRLVRRLSLQRGRFLFTFSSGVRMPVLLVLTSAPPFRILGLWFGIPLPPVRSLDEVAARLAEFPGRTSLLIRRIGTKPETLASLNPDEPLAVASAFKLYILAALVHDRKNWADVVRLQDACRSLDSGTMHHWPAGSPVTVHTLALNMIAASDNTAADHLLHYVGRKRLEALLSVLGHGDPARNIPFPSTLEVFKLKSSEKIRREYLAADPESRRAILEGPLKNIPRDRVGQPTTPTAIDSIEWFASASDLCRLMTWFHEKQDETALKILATHPGLEDVSGAYEYIGYKGGSEPGVLNHTFLLRSPKGVYVLSAGWNNPAADLDAERFFALVQAALLLVGSK